MTSVENFNLQLSQGYDFSPLVALWQAKYKEKVTDIQVGIPLSMLNRHGLIAWATGTGKTKTVQLLVEGCSLAGVPTLVMDMKGDVSWLAVAGEAKDFILERYSQFGKEYIPHWFDTEFMSLTGKTGYQRRTTIIELGPLMLAQMLELNDTQTSALSAIFLYCDREGLALLDLEDLQSVLKYLSQKEINEDFSAEYGLLSPATLSVILRKTITLEQQEGKVLFWEPSLDIDDLLTTNSQGEWKITIFKLEDSQSKPNLFCTAILWILAELYTQLPEAGDLKQPKLVMIVDEAHLLFQLASPALQQQIETMIKLIRSKGVGIFFCTQLPDDIPAPILSQLGTKIQHALRAFTERDRKAMKTALENYPITEFYTTSELITSLWVWEILFTTLNPKGIPTPLAHVYNYTPRSRMDVLSSDELQWFLEKSSLVTYYNQVIDRDSATEILSKKLDTNDRKSSSWDDSSGPSLLSKIVKSKIVKDLTKSAWNSVVRELLGYLGIKVRKNKTFF